jgi:hypothetical protein
MNETPKTLVERLHDAAKLGCNIPLLRKLHNNTNCRLDLTDGTTIWLGGIENLLDQQRFRKIVASSHLRHFIPQFKDDDWYAIVQTILDIAIETDCGPESQGTSKRGES